MNQRRPNSGPRPQQTRTSPQGKNPQHWNRYRRPWPPYWYDYYDWYDYDWYDYYDYDEYDYDEYDYYRSSSNTAASEKNKRPMSARSNTNGPAEYVEYTESQMIYQQGFKDGWKSAMNYMMGGMDPVEPVEPIPVPVPTPSTTPPTEGASE